MGAYKKNEWDKVAFIRNRIANKEDVIAGRAVFYIEDVEKEYHSYLPIPTSIPSLVFQVDSETRIKTLAVIIQAEKVNEDSIIGVRYFEGGNGICSLNEIEFIE